MTLLHDKVTIGSERTVSGALTAGRVSARRRYTVRAFDIDLRSEEQVGDEALTKKDGR